CEHLMDGISRNQSLNRVFGPENIDFGYIPNCRERSDREHLVHYNQDAEVRPQGGIDLRGRPIYFYAFRNARPEGSSAMAPKNRRLGFVILLVSLFALL